MALLFAGLPYLVGYLMIALANLIGDVTAFKAVLLTGRLLTGVGVGCSYQAVPVSSPFFFLKQGPHPEPMA